MEKTVTISVKAKQEMGDGPADSMELVTQGVLQRDGDIYILSYQESEVTGLEGTLTTFHVEPERITLMRMGEFNSQMVFELGRRHLSMYNTPYGALSIGVNTRHLLAELDDRGGSIEIDYDLELEHAMVGHNSFSIRVKETPEGGSLRQ